MCLLMAKILGGAGPPRADQQSYRRRLDDLKPSIVTAPPIHYCLLPLLLHLQAPNQTLDQRDPAKGGDVFPQVKCDLECLDRAWLSLSH